MAGPPPPPPPELRPPRPGQTAAPVQGFGYWTAELVKSSDPEQVAALLNRRYDALFRLWNEVPRPFKKIAEDGLRLG